MTKRCTCSRQVGKNTGLIADTKDRQSKEDGEADATLIRSNLSRELAAKTMGGRVCEARQIAGLD